MPIKKRGVIAALIVLLVFCGVLFYRLFGFQILDPRFDGWLINGDAISHYAGWLFYREAPWGLPLGKFDNLLWPIGSLTLQMDSNTFFAVIFKVLSPFLGEPFQYFGIWIFVCYFLQGYFGWKLLQKFNFSFWESIWGAGFFVWAPILVARMGHMSLLGHWMILAILNLYFSKERSWKTFLGLLAIASISIFVHPYLFLMVFGLSVAFFASEVARVGIGWVVFQYLCFGAVSGVMCFLGGYLEKNDPTTDFNFGGYSADLLTFLNPGFLANKFSILLPRLRVAGGQYEGFGFLGIGVVGILFYLLFCWRKEFFKKIAFVEKKISFLTIVCLAFFIYALSSKITFGGNQILNLSFVYDLLQPIPSIFRSSGRFIWPLYYLVILAALVGLSKAWDNRKIPLSFLLCAIFAVQFFDSFSSYPYFHPLIPNFESPLAAETVRWFREHQIKQVVFVPPYIVTGKISCYERNGFEFTQYRDWVRFIARENLVFNSGVTSRSSVQVQMRCQNFWTDLPELMNGAHNVFVVHADYKTQWSQIANAEKAKFACKLQGGYEICLKN